MAATSASAPAAAAVQVFDVDVPASWLKESYDACFIRTRIGFTCKLCLASVSAMKLGNPCGNGNAKVQHIAYNHAWALSAEHRLKYPDCYPKWRHALTTARLPMAVPASTVSPARTANLAHAAALFAIMDGRPLSVVEHPGFHALTSALGVSGTVSRSTVSRRVGDLWKLTKPWVGKQLKRAAAVGHAVCLVHDAWSAPDGTAVVGISVRYCDEDGAITELPIAYLALADDERETAEVLRDTIIAALERIECTADIVSFVVSDRGAAGRKAGKLMMNDVFKPETNAMTCGAHDWNNMMKASLGDSDVADFYKAVRGFVSTVRFSRAHRARYGQAPSMSETRFNTFATLCEWVVEKYDVIMTTPASAMADKSLKSAYDALIPVFFSTAAKREDVNTLSSLLTTMSGTIQALSSESTLVAAKFAYDVEKVHEVLIGGQTVLGAGPLTKAACAKMLHYGFGEDAFGAAIDGAQRRLDETMAPPRLAAALLDPRTNHRLPDAFVSRAYAALKQQVTALYADVAAAPAPASAAASMSKLAATLKLKTAEPKSLTLMEQFEVEFAAMSSLEMKEDVSDEVVLGVFFKDDYVVDNEHLVKELDISKRKVSLRILRRAAANLFAVPMHAMTQERNFSIIGNIWNDRRNRLDPERAESLAMMKILATDESFCKDVLMKTAIGTADAAGGDEDDDDGDIVMMEQVAEGAGAVASHGGAGAGAAVAAAVSGAKRRRCDDGEHEA